MNTRDYNIYDWIGNDDFRPLAKRSKRERNRLFSLFSVRLPNACKELQKLLPHIALDHSISSLRALDAWLTPELDTFIQEHPDQIPYLQLKRNSQGLLPYWPSVFNTCPPLWRSIGTDLYIYAIECLIEAIDREGYPDHELRWEISDGKAQSGNEGFPDVVGHYPFNLNMGGTLTLISGIASYLGNPVMNARAKCGPPMQLSGLVTSSLAWCKNP